MAGNNDAFAAGHGGAGGAPVKRDSGEVLIYDEKGRKTSAPEGSGVTIDGKTLSHEEFAELARTNPTLHRQISNLRETGRTAGIMENENSSKSDVTKSGGSTSQSNKPLGKVTTPTDRNARPKEVLNKLTQHHRVLDAFAKTHSGAVYTASKAEPEAFASHAAATKSLAEVSTHLATARNYFSDRNAPAANEQLQKAANKLVTAHGALNGSAMRSVSGTEVSIPANDLASWKEHAGNLQVFRRKGESFPEANIGGNRLRTGTQLFKEIRKAAKGTIVGDKMDRAATGTSRTPEYERGEVARSSRSERMSAPGSGEKLTSFTGSRGGEAVDTTTRGTNSGTTGEMDPRKKASKTNVVRTGLYRVTLPKIGDMSSKPKKRMKPGDKLEGRQFMAEFHELNSEQQKSIKNAHPEFDSYAPKRQAAVIEDRLNKDKRNTRIKEVKAAALKQEMNVDAHPLGYQQSLFDSVKHIENAANDMPEVAMKDVHSHIAQAYSSIDAHLAEHNKQEYATAAGHLSNAAGSISSAVRAYDIHSPMGTSEGGTSNAELIAKHVKNIANSYKFNVANGKLAQVKQAKPLRELSDFGAQLDKQRVREGKQWQAVTNESNTATKQVSPTVQRVSEADKAAERQSNLSLKRDQRGLTPDYLTDPKFNRPAATYNAPEYKTGAQKYLGTLARYGEKHRGKVVVSRSDLPEWQHHRDIAVNALHQGHSIPDETKAVLGTHGLEIARKSYNKFLEGFSSPAVEPQEDAPRGGRGGSLKDFAEGRG